MITAERSPSSYRLWHQCDDFWHTLTQWLDDSMLETLLWWSHAKQSFLTCWYCLIMISTYAVIPGIIYPNLSRTTDASDKIQSYSSAMRTKIIQSLPSLLSRHHHHTMKYLDFPSFIYQRPRHGRSNPWCVVLTMSSDARHDSIACSHWTSTSGSVLSVS